MSNIAIRLQNLSKRYQRGSRSDSLRESMSGAWQTLRRRLTGTGQGRAEASSFWALREISMTVNQGELVGIVGGNGAGKSTLLKIIAGITEPTEGVAEWRGRVGSLLEVGAGFHLDLSGRDNVFLSGAILGMGRREIQRKFDEIVEFSEIGPFLDTPVKRYSSGMFIRLAFAVAAHLEPEILVVDEVLAVGDTAFQRKCLNKMRGFIRQGRTILFVTHDMGVVQALCPRACFLERGRLVADGPTAEVVSLYLEKNARSAAGSLAERTDRYGSGALRFTDARLLGRDAAVVTAATSGEDTTLAIDYETPDGLPLKDVAIRVTLQTASGQVLSELVPEVAGFSLRTLPPRGRIFCHLPGLQLSGGIYEFGLEAEAGGVMADSLRPAGRLMVTSADFYGSGVIPAPHKVGILLPQRWEVEEREGLSVTG